MTIITDVLPPRSLPEGFRFSQSSLQDFCDCRRRFQLRYLQNLAWPAVQSEPALENERFMLRGSVFHRLIQQYFSSVPLERLQEAVSHAAGTDADLAAWWEHFVAFARQEKLDHLLSAETPCLFSEKSLSAPLGSRRLIAQYDLLRCVAPGRLIIYDWKTSRKRPQRKWLAERIQTRLYPYLFVQAGHNLNAGQTIKPQDIEMIYWFAVYPEQPERFHYSQADYERDAAFLSDLINEIINLQPDQFTLTTQENRCAYCVYRSLCNRGEQAGMFQDSMDVENDPTHEILLDFEQLTEIEFG